MNALPAGSRIERKLIAKLNHHFTHCNKLLQTETFSGLDRIQLWKDHLDPMQEQLRSLFQLKDLQVPTWLTTIQWEDHHPFSNQWINPDSFSQIPDTIRSDRLVELGQLLFIDPILSSNNKRSCASCHRPEKAFTDGRATSKGFDFSEQLTRNAPTLVNAVFNRRFAHDMRFNSLQAQIGSVFNHQQEFRTSMEEVLAKLNTSEAYHQQFKSCFPAAEVIDSVHIIWALSAYVESLTQFSSPFDQFMRGDIQRLSPSAQKGFNLFMGKAKCGSCHFPPLFSGLKPLLFIQQEYHSPSVHLGQSIEEANATAKSKFEYCIKTPTVRNVVKTLPYLHTGAVLELEEILSFWSIPELSTPCKIKRGNNVMEPPQKLSPEEQHALLAFLNSLSEENHFPIPEHIALPPTDGSLAPTLRRSGGLY